jgi:hypothetical protein
MLQAGFPKSEIATGIGVAQAESGLNPNAHNSKPPDDSYGLFQINMLGALGPARRKEFGISKNEQLYDPQTNVRAAYKVWKSSGWKAWTTYTSGAYKNGNNPIPSPGDVAGGVKDKLEGLNPVNGVTKAIDNFGKTLLKGGLSFAAGFIATGLVIVGIIILSGQSKKAAQVVKTVGKVAIK